MSVKVNIDKNWSNKVVDKVHLGLLEMSTDIHRRAIILAPKLTRALVNSGKIRKSGIMEYTISFGSAKVPYARKRHFENKKNPQTIGYLAKAGDGVTRGNTAKYFRGKV